MADGVFDAKDYTEGGRKKLFMFLVSRFFTFPVDFTFDNRELNANEESRLLKLLVQACECSKAWLHHFIRADDTPRGHHDIIRSEIFKVSDPDAVVDTLFDMLLHFIRKYVKNFDLVRNMYNPKGDPCPVPDCTPVPLAVIEEFHRIQQPIFRPMADMSVFTDKLKQKQDEHDRRVAERLAGAAEQDLVPVAAACPGSDNDDEDEGLTPKQRMYKLRKAKETEKAYTKKKGSASYK